MSVVSPPKHGETDPDDPGDEELESGSSGSDGSGSTTRRSRRRGASRADTGSGPDTEPEDDDTAAGEPPRRRVSGRATKILPELIAILGLFGVAFGQATGNIVVDTKLDLAIAPARFLSNATHLWDPLQFFGSVQNQAYGYLFPMGPYFAAGHALGVPAWIVERSWLGLLLAVAFWGTVLVARAMGIGGRWSQLVGGLAYALSPLFLTAALTSAGLLPAVLLPWVLLPLIRAGQGKTSIGAAAARSGLAVLCMGGVNATSTAAVLVMPIIWFATRKPSPERNRLFVMWIGAVFAACLWFLAGLAFQGKYGFNFIPYTETAADTTRLASVPETLRGGGVWLSLVTINGIWTPAGYIYETIRPIMIASAAVAGGGLWGLTRRGVRERLFLVLTTVIGTLVICVGFWGRLGGPLANVDHDLFFGPLAALRNVYKFEPLVTLPLTLGLVATVSTWVSMAQRAAKTRESARKARLAIIALVVGVLGLSSLPAFTGKLYPTGSFSSLPAYWHQATQWLNARGALSTTLVLPGAEFGRFSWGTTNDQPIEPLSDVPWTNRDIAPLGSIGNTQFLDAVDQVLIDGQPVSGLDQFLARAGVRYLLVENDLNTTDTSSPPPVAVRTLLAAEPGIHRVAQFGPLANFFFFDSGAQGVVNYDPNGYTQNLRSLEVYRVDPTSLHQSEVTTYPAHTGVQLSGGPQGELAMANAGELGNEAVGLTGDPLAPKFTHTTFVDTDTQQLRDTQFGLLYNQVSYILKPGEAAPTVGGQPKQWIVVPGENHETVSVIHGAASITASSYGTPVTEIPGYQPLGAFLKDPESMEWVVSGIDTDNPWIQITFDHPIPVSTIKVTPLHDGPWRPPITSIAVETSTGTVHTKLAPSQTPQPVRTTGGMTSFLRITLTGVAKPQESAADAGPGIAHIAIPGVTVTQSYQLPDDGPKSAAADTTTSTTTTTTSSTTTTPTPSYLFTAPLPNGFAYLTPTDDDPHLSRIITLQKAATFTVKAVVSPRTGPGLLDRFAGNSQISLTTSSTFGNLPLFGPANLDDADNFSAWWAGGGDEDPTITYKWPKTLTISSLEYQPDDATSRPTEARLTDSAGHHELVQLPLFGGKATFPPMTTNSVTISFPKVQYIEGYNLLTQNDTAQPMGIGHITFPALKIYRPTGVNLDQRFVLRCGQGPGITVDGHTYPTSVHTTYGRLLALAPIKLTVCTTGSTITLGAGTHTVTADDATGGLKITSLSLLGSSTSTSSAPRSAAGSALRSAGTRKITIDNWDQEHRVITAGPGAAVIVNVKQNYNPGWVATVNGHTLPAVRLDGWQQGYELPASATPQRIVLAFVPGSQFREALAVGGVLAALLVLWALVPGFIRRRFRFRLRRSRSSAPGGGGPDSDTTSAATSAAASASVASPTADSPTAASPTAASAPMRPGHTTLEPRGEETGRPWLVAVLVTLAIYLVAGPMALVIPLVLVLRRSSGPTRQRYLIAGNDQTLVVHGWSWVLPLPWIALVTEIIAGVAVAAYATINGASEWVGQLGYGGQFFGAIALAMLTLSLVPDQLPPLPSPFRRPRRNARGPSHAAPSSRPRGTPRESSPDNPVAAP